MCLLDSTVLNWAIQITQFVFFPLSLWIVSFVNILRDQIKKSIHPSGSLFTECFFLNGLSALTIIFRLWKAALWCLVCKNIIIIERQIQESAKSGCLWPKNLMQWEDCFLHGFLWLWRHMRQLMFHSKSLLLHLGPDRKEVSTISGSWRVGTRR